MTRLSDLADRIHVKLDDATVEKVIGRKNKGRNLQRRRVHWYRSEGEIVPSVMAGGTVTSAGDDVTGSREPAVWVRFETITCEVFAESEGTLDTLLDNLIVAIDQSERQPAVEWQGYDWASVNKDEFAKRIPNVTLVFTSRMPVVDEIKALTEITAEDLTCEIDEDL